MLAMKANLAKLLGTALLGLSGLACGGMNAWTSITGVPGTGFGVAIAVHPTSPATLFVARRLESSSSMDLTQGVFRSVDGGASWSQVFTDPLGQIGQILFDPSTPSTLYLFRLGQDSSGGLVYRSTNGGTDWVLKNFGLVASVQSLAVDPVHPGTLYAHTFDASVSRIYKSANAGDSWIDLGIDFASQVGVVAPLAVDPGTGNVIVGTTNGVARSTDGGATWVNTAFGASVGTIGFAGTTGMVYAGAKFPGPLFRSGDRGATWDYVVSRFMGPHFDLALLGPQTVWDLAADASSHNVLMIATTCGFWKSLDGGLTFSEASAGLRWLNQNGRCYFGGGSVANSPAAPGEFFTPTLIQNDTPPFASDPGRYTLNASILPPLCELTATPGVVPEGGSTTLTAYCSPGATQYTWSANTGFSASVSTGTVSPSGATTYSVTGMNANGSSGPQSVKVWAAGPRAANISTRAQVLTGDDVMIAGFVIDGPTAKTVVVRARGPSLAAAGVQGVLANPTLQLMQGAAVLRENDDWPAAPNAGDIQASGFPPAQSEEPAVLMTLNPGAYTVIVRGVGGTTGVGIVEVFEVDHPETPLVNISTRALVQGGADVMIGGFIIQGMSPLRVVVRARGPSLSGSGISNPLSDPFLQVFSGATSIAVNGDWMNTANAAELQSLGLAPASQKEAAILMTLEPGAYTAIVTGAGGGTGVGIVEVFSVP